MRRSLIRRVGPGMALLALGLLGAAVVELGAGLILAHEPYPRSKNCDGQQAATSGGPR